MAHPELLNSKVLFKPKHWFPIDLEIELVYRLNLKVFQFLLEFCENGLICLLWFFTKLKVLKVYIEILQSKKAIYLDYLSCCFWSMWYYGPSHSLRNTFSKMWQSIIPNFCKTKIVPSHHWKHHASFEMGKNSRSSLK